MCWWWRPRRGARSGAAESPRSARDARKVRLVFSDGTACSLPEGSVWAARLRRAAERLTGPPPERLTAPPPERLTAPPPERLTAPLAARPAGAGDLSAAGGQAGGHPTDSDLGRWPR